MREVRLSIIFFHNLLDGYECTLKKQDLCYKEKVFQTNVVRFYGKGHANKSQNFCGDNNNYCSNPRWNLENFMSQKS